MDILKRRTSTSRSFIAAIVLAVAMLLPNWSFAQVDNRPDTIPAAKDHGKVVIGYITQWDAWKEFVGHVPKGAYNQLNLDYSQYTILNFSFFGVAKDGSLHSGDARNKNIYKPEVDQDPAPIIFPDPYSSWDNYILYGSGDILWYIDQRVQDLGYIDNGNGGWTNTNTGESGPYPLWLANGNKPGLLELGDRYGVTVMAAIGGWSMSKHYPQVAASASLRQNFIRDCIKLMDMGFDGIDFDWEFPNKEGMNNWDENGPLYSTADYGNVCLLGEELRTALNANGYSNAPITSCLSINFDNLRGYDWNRFHKVFKYGNVMAYDFNGGWSNIAGHNAPLYESSLSEWDNLSYDEIHTGLTTFGCDISKMNFGSPFYGRGVICSGNAALGAPTVKKQITVQPDGPINTAADYDNWPLDQWDGTPFYSTILHKVLGGATMANAEKDRKELTYSSNGWTKHWDDESKVPYMTNGKYFLSYDDPRSIFLKAEYIKNAGYAGVIIWQVYQDMVELTTGAQTIEGKLTVSPNTKSPLIYQINYGFGKTPTTKPPVVEITEPTENQNYPTAPANVTVRVTATDEDDAIAKVTLFKDDGATKVGEDLTAPYEFTMNNLAAGDYNLTAKAVDAAGNMTTSTVRNFSVGTVTNIPPTITILTPTAGQSVSGSTVMFTVDAADADGQVVDVEYFNGNTSLSVQTQSPYSFNWTSVMPGQYTIRAVAKDNKGAKSEATVMFTVVGTTGGGITTCDLSEIMTEQMWATFFPNRYGTPGHSQNTTDDFFSYNNFKDAVNEMAKISIKIERRCGMNSVTSRITRTDKSTGASTVIYEGADFNADWNQSKPLIIEEVDYGKFICDGDVVARKRELMAFLANTSQETTGGWATAPGGMYSWGFYYREEVGMESCNPSCSNPSYVDQGNTAYPPAPGKSYHGRGPIQLSWNYNYGACSEFLYGDKNVLLNNPEKVIESGKTAFQTGIWFWMQPQAPKRSCHTVMMPSYVPTPKEQTANIVPGFGTTVNIINGGLECRGTTENDKVKNRIGFYERYCGLVSVSMELNGGNDAADCGCVGQKEFPLDETECTNPPPVVAITAPVNGAIFVAVPANITIDATASVSVGTITKVEFYHGSTKLGEDASSPYSFAWNGVAAGDYALTAKAISSGGATGTSSVVNITVGEKINQLPVISIAYPNDGDNFPAPASITIEANASDADGYITKVEFYDGNLKIGEDVNEPFTFAYTNIPPGAYVLSAKAIDDLGGTATSQVVNIKVKNESIGNPSGSLEHTIIGYWHNFDNGSRIVKLGDVDPNYNVIQVAFAETDHVNDAATLIFNVDPAVQSEESFKADVLKLQGEGRKVLISMGGQNGIIALKNQEDVTKFVTSLKGIVDEYNFDGLDIDLEGGHSLAMDPDDKDPFNPSTPGIKLMIQAVAEVAAYYKAQGKDFWLTMAPEVWYFQQAYGQAYGNGNVGAYIPLVIGLRNHLTVFHPQLYNTGSIMALDGKAYAQGTPDFAVAMSDMLLTGFPIMGSTPARTFEPLRPDQVAMGLPCTPNAAPGGGYLTMGDFWNALDYIVAGVPFGGAYTLQGSPDGYPEFRGVMTWSINWDIWQTPENEWSDTAYEYFFGQYDQPSTPPSNMLVSDVLRIETLGGSAVLTSTTSDPDGLGIEKVEFYKDGVLAGSVTTGTGDQYTYTMTFPEAGVYTVSSKSIDKSGAYTVSNKLKITVTNGPPPACPPNAWNSNTVYNTDDMVHYEGRAYRAKWYSQGDLPTSGDPWEDKGACGDAPNTEPIVQILSPAKGATFPDPSDVTIVAGATDIDGTITKVDFYSGSTLWGTGTKGSDGNYSYTKTGLTKGVYNIVAKATDNLNDIGSSAPVSITVGEESTGSESTAPRVQITRVYPEGTNNTYIQPADYTVQVNAYEGVDGVGSVTLYESTTAGTAGTEVATSTTGDEFNNYRFDITGKNEGEYFYTAKATNKKTSTLVGSTTTETKVTVVTEDETSNLAPFVSITAPTNGSTFDEGATVFISAQASDNDGTISKVEIKLDGAIVATLTAAPYKYNYSPAVAGNHVVVAVATDNLGKATTSDAVNFVVNSPEVDDDLPFVEITSPATNTNFETPASFNINMTFGDDGSNDDAVTTLELLVNDQIVTTVADPVSPYTFRYEQSAVGTYRLQARVYDKAQQRAFSSVVVVYVKEVGAADLIPPTVVITEPANNTNVNAGETFKIVASTTPAPGRLISKVEFHDVSGKLGEATSYPYEFSVSAEARKYSLTAVAIDDAGAEGVSSVVIVNGINANKAPYCRVLDPSNRMTVIPTDGVVPITVDAGDSDGNVVKVEIYLNNDIIATLDAPTSGGNIFEATWNSPTNGDHTVKAIATDDKGAKTESTVNTFTVSSDPTADTKPKIEIINPKNGDIFAPGTSLVISALATDPGGKITEVKFFYSIDNGKTQQLLGGVKNPTSGDEYIWETNGLAVGSYIISATAFDNDGQNTISNPVSITVSDNLELIDCENIPAYIATTSYTKGTRIKYDDAVYESLTDGNIGATPGTDNTKWKHVGTCKTVAVSGEITPEKDIIVKLYPNPIKASENGELKVVVKTQKGNRMTIKFIWMQNMQVVHTVTPSVSSETGEVEYYIDVSKLPRGAYTVLVDADSGQDNTYLLIH